MKDFFIETERLYLLPLKRKYLKLWLNDINLLESELNCIYEAEPLTGTFRSIVKGQMFCVENDERNYLYHSFWLLIRKKGRTIIGSADFKGLPNEDGEVEIGYGLGKPFEHNGFMTEAVESMCNWAFHQEEIVSVIAETDKGNLPSERILKRCGFSLYYQSDSNWWRKERDCVLN